MACSDYITVLRQYHTNQKKHTKMFSADQTIQNTMAKKSFLRRNSLCHCLKQRIRKKTWTISAYENTQAKTFILIEALAFKKRCFSILVQKTGRKEKNKI